MSALVAVLSAAIPALSPAQALAGRGTDDAPAKTHAKAHARPASGAKGKRAAKGSSSERAKGKKTAKKGEAPRRRCTGTPITLDRGGLEGQTLTLLDCNARAVESSQVALSVLARPWGAAKPAALPAHPDKEKARPAGTHMGELAPGVRLLDKGLLARLDAVAHRFPGRTISLVSGYRPQSRGSLHQSARALDLRVAGVTNEELVAFCKTLPDTGCGYYPNSSFVHVDVRAPGTGGVSWIDASGPGEAPHYVRRWPLPPEEADQAMAPPDARGHDGADDPWGLDEGEHTADPDPYPP